MKHLREAHRLGWILISSHGFTGQTWRRNEYCIATPSSGKAVNQDAREAVTQDNHEAVNQDDLNLPVVNSPQEHLGDRSVAEQIFLDLQTLHPDHRAPNWGRWINDVRLMREQDRRTHDQVLEMWEFAHGDSFWKANILSPDKLRKHWDRLAIK